MLLRSSPFKHLALTHFLEEGYIRVQEKRGKRHSKRFDWVPRYRAAQWMHSLEEIRQTVADARYDWGAAWLPSYKDTIWPAIKEIKEAYSK